MGFGAKPQARSQGASLSALRLIFKSSAFEPPIISPARMPGVYAKRLCTMQSPPSIHNPSQRGRGLGCRQGCLKVSAKSASGRCATERSQRDREFVLLIKKIDFFNKLRRLLYADGSRLSINPRIAEHSPAYLPYKNAACFTQTAFL